MDNKSSFTKQPLKRIIKKAGAKRVSGSAGVRLGEIIETFAAEVLSKSKSLAEHSGRKTIMKDDIRVVVKQKK